MEANSNITENSMENSNPREISTSSEPSFSIVDAVTERGKPKLFEKYGYAYNYHRTFGNKSKSKCYFIYNTIIKYSFTYLLKCP